MELNNNIFPALNKRVAYYDPFGMYINLEFIDEADFNANRTENIITPKSAYDWSIYNHELTHWIDHHCSIWGQLNIIHFYNAVNARLNGDPSEFYRIKNYHDKTKTDYQYNYYTQIYEQQKIREIWNYNTITFPKFNLEGKYEKGNVLMAIELFSSEKEKIGIIPLTISTLLECRATNNEYQIHQSVISLIDDPIQNKISLNEMNEKFLNEFYNPNFMRYNVLGHVISRTLGLNHAELIYEIGNKISNLCLNFPLKLLHKIPQVETEDKLGENYYNNLKKNCDRGFLFYNLLYNLKISGALSNNYSTILSENNLPDLNSFNNLVLEEMNKNLERLIPGPFYKIAKTQLELGIKLYEEIGVSNHNQENIKSMLKFEIAPKMIFGDTFYNDVDIDAKDFISGLNKNEIITIEEEYNFYQGMKEHFDTFINACGI